MSGQKLVIPEEVLPAKRYVLSTKFSPFINKSLAYLILFMFSKYSIVYGLHLKSQESRYF